MRMTSRPRRVAVPLAPLLTLALSLGSVPATPALEWPAVTAETKPWTRWWWMGSSVTPAGITASLEAYRDAGLGGVEVTPIYGVRGREAEFVPYLSPAWVDRLEHTLGEARRLDLGVDMATGTGWPFGGPWVGADLAPRSIAHKTWVLAAGQRLQEPVRFRQEPLVRTVRGQSVRPVEPVEANPDLQALALDQVRFAKDLSPQAVIAYPDAGAWVDLTSRVSRDGTLDWVAPAGTWTVYAIFPGDHGKLVERAAPGGEGNVIDHFSAAAIRAYLGHFDRAFSGRQVTGLRGYFNDSYEVDDASGQGDWTPGLLDAFQERRGYDLRGHLPALFGKDSEERNARVLVDYRETVSDLLLDTFTRAWRDWAHGRGALARNQAHGSPGNILDLYAATDIPETEGSEILRIKWATSAAHVSGKRLASAEAATWLGEHFLSTPGDVRQAVDRFFVGGVNHIVYHGTAYSPAGEPWPGWLFYAAVHFNPQNPWWADFGALNRYVARVQSFLQQGQPDADVLLYFPFHDALAVRGRGLLEHFGDARVPLERESFGQAAQTLLKRGYPFDYVSDRQVQQVTVGEGRLVTGGTSFQTVLVPALRFMPLSTFQRLLALAREGATVAVHGALPADVTGMADLEARRGEMRRLAADIPFGGAAPDGVREARVGRGRVLLGPDLEPLLARAGARREEMVDRGLQFTRRRLDGGQVYFVVHAGETPIDGWVPLAAAASRVALFEPVHGGSGYARTRSAGREVYLQLGPGESVVLVTSPGGPAGPQQAYWKPTQPGTEITGAWSVRFDAGGPELPPEVTTPALQSWTAFAGDAAREFSGTATYTITFPRPTARAAAFRLDLGRVQDSARVRLNGRDLGTLLGPGFHRVVGSRLISDRNVLEVTVSGGMANRIAGLERRQVPWKKFYNINFPSRLPANRGPDGLFRASHWEPLPSGLLGPVTLTPMAAAAP